MVKQGNPVLYIVIPCYNEQEVLPITAPMFLEKVDTLTKQGKISPESRVLFVNDGSKDDTWSIICELSKKDPRYTGICLSRNRGHQNALLAGLMEAKGYLFDIIKDCLGSEEDEENDQLSGNTEE